MIRQWDIVISGFRQSRADPTGAERLWLELREFSSTKRCVQRFDWDEDWDGIAAWMHRVSARGETVIRLYTYSWGGGWGAPHLARALRLRKMVVNVVVMADPVYRSKLLPSWLPFNPLSMLSVPTITMPDNVREVHWSYQRLNRPQGHRIVAEDKSATQVHKGHQRYVPHEQMDDDPWWFDTALEVAQAGVTA